MSYDQYALIHAQQHRDRQIARRRRASAGQAAAGARTRTTGRALRPRRSGCSSASGMPWAPSPTPLALQPARSR